MTDPLSFTDRSPLTGLPYLFAGQSQKEPTVNEALARIDALLSRSVEGESGSPPPAPADGECWIVGTSANGPWDGHDGDLAFFTAGAWLFAPPQPGWQVYDRAAGLRRTWIDGWHAPTLPAEPAGGTTIDVEARAVIAALIEELRSAAVGG